MENGFGGETRQTNEPGLGAGRWLETGTVAEAGSGSAMQERLGEVAANTGATADIEAAANGETGAAETLTLTGIDMETGMRETAELKPLAADGSTEGRLGKIAVQLSGDLMDETSAREVQEKIQEYKNDPFRLQNYRDETMVESLRDNYGRIFGDDGNESGGVGENWGSAGQSGRADLRTKSGVIGGYKNGMNEAA